MEQVNLVKLNYVFNQCNIFVRFNTCVHEWGIIHNTKENRPKKIIADLIDKLNDILLSDFKFVYNKGEVISYSLYDKNMKIITFYKKDDKEAKHGIFIIHEQKLFSDFIEDAFDNLQ